MRMVREYEYAQEKIDELFDRRPVAERIESQAAQRRLKQMQKKREKDEKSKDCTK